MIIPESNPYRIARRAGKQGARPADTVRYAVEKQATVLIKKTPHKIYTKITDLILQYQNTQR